MIVTTKPSALSVVASIICAISGIWTFACGLKSLNQFQILLGCSLLLNGLQIGARWVMLRELNRNYLSCADLCYVRNRRESKSGI